MERVFLKLLNISITAGWLVLAIVVLRFLLKKAPKALRVCLWALVGLRLVFPFSVQSVLSLIPSAQTLPPDILVSETPVIQSGIPALNAAVNPVLSEALAPTMGASVNPAQSVASIASMIWLAGIAAMLIYSAASYLRLRRQVRVSLLLRDNIHLCDSITSPFILGIFRPRIYLPSGLTEEQARFVIAHEQAHLKRKDHLWKPFGFLLLSVYWFHPALWLAYILLCRDIEFACDEKVIRDMGGSDKRGYSETLLFCSAGRRAVIACPLAFGEVDVKARIKSVLHYKKPAFWIILLTIVLGCAVAVAFLTDPVTKPEATVPESLSVDVTQPAQNTEDPENTEPVDGPQSNAPLNREIPFTSGVSWVNYYGGDALLQTSLNANSLGIYSSIYPKVIPVLKLETAADLTQFRSEFGGILALDVDHAGYPSFEKVTAAMDDTFFAENTALLVYITASSGSQRFRAQSVCADENTLYVDVLREDPSGTGTADMAGWLVTVTVSKSAIQDITSYRADIGVRYGDDFDEWGLRMNLTWQSDTEFDVTFTHSAQWASAIGTLAVSSQYEIRAVYNGETISFGDYMNVLHMDYAEPDLRGSFPLRTIERDGSLTFHTDLADTYGALPVGEYVLCKIVTLKTDAGEDTLEKVYSVRFAVADSGDSMGKQD